MSSHSDETGPAVDDVDAASEQTFLTPGADGHLAETIDSVVPSGPPRDSRHQGVPNHRVLGELGRGGMGVVYLAEQTDLGRPVALKMLRTGGRDTEEAERLRAEATAVAALTHDAIVQIYEVGEHDGDPWVSLEYLAGGTLSDRIRDHPLSSTEAAELVATLADAVSHAHERGIVHRDLKPGNVLMTEDGRPKVSDFGLVKRLDDDSHSTRTGAILGTPAYMAPEQAAGSADVGPPADIYALGSVLYAVLTGRPPFLAESPMATIGQVLHEEAVPPSRLQPKLHRDLETICLKCLEKRPDQRYASAAEVRDELRRFGRGEPIVARPVGRAERVWRWCRRNPAVAVPSGLAAASTLAVAIGAPVAAYRIEERRRAADDARVAAVEAAERAIEAEREADRLRGVAEQEADRAETEAAAAAEQRNLAVGALGLLVNEVQKKLADRPGVSDLRESLLKTAISGLDQVAERSPENGLADVRTAQAHRRMGDVYSAAGHTERALSEYEKTHSIVEALGEAGTLPRPLENRAYSHDRIGDVLIRLGRTDAAKDHFERALSLRRQWHDALDDPSVETEQVIALSLSRLTKVERELGRTAAAAAHLELLAELRERWVREQPKNPNARREMAGTHMRIGDVHLDAGEFAAAATSYESARLGMEVMTEIWPRRVSPWVNLALADRKLATAYAYAGSTDEAAAHYRAALGTLESLEDPDQASVAVQRAVAHYQLGALLDKDGREGADAHFEAAEILRRRQHEADPKDVYASVSYALVLARLGRVEEAVALAESTLANDQSTLLALNVACTYAQAMANADDTSLASDYRERALALLRRAVEESEGLPEMIRTDWDLNPLRPLPEFQALLAAAP